MVLKMKYSGIRLFYNLILFFGITACQVGEKHGTPVIEWENGKAVGVFIPFHLIEDIPEDLLFDHLTIHLTGTEQPAIPGELRINDKDYYYAPIIPFTRGLNYEIRLKGDAITTFEIPIPDPAEAPQVVSVYPSSDTLPENLLKFYFQFSKPMREGQSQKHIVLLKNKSDTLFHTFLDLQPELWDEKGEWLTLWLDPGRIKRDLQPNQQLGAPLEKGVWYRLVIDGPWQDKEGSKLAASWSKDFFVSGRDSQSPVPEKWTLVSPDEGTRDTLRIEFNESLDYVLATEAIVISDKEGNVIPGEISLGRKESVFKFTPRNSWPRGEYRLQAEVRLEDLAGNNLDRLFDRDVSTRETRPVKTREIYMRTFTIE
jgi:hypothetical protein